MHDSIFSSPHKTLKPEGFELPSVEGETKGTMLSQSVPHHDQDHAQSGGDNATVEKVEPNANVLSEDDDIVELEWLLRYISGILKQRGREILSQFPITPPQFVALQWLKEHGDMTIGELSEKMYLANSTTTDLIDRMEANGLVARRRSEADRRVVHIHLLDKGKTIIEEVIHRRQTYLKNILDSFDPALVSHLVDSLSMLYRRMKDDA